jgi:hypothetical protein
MTLGSNLRTTAGVLLSMEYGFSAITAAGSGRRPDELLLGSLK